MKKEETLHFEDISQQKVNQILSSFLQISLEQYVVNPQISLLKHDNY